MVRSFTLEEKTGGLTLDQASRVLFAVQGCTDRKWGLPLRTAPSAGATYPLTAYAVVRDVEGVEPGLYRYVSTRPLEHGLELVEEGGSSGAPLTVLLECEPERTMGVYGSRGRMYVNEEVGHVIQNAVVECGVLWLALRATARPAKKGVVAEIDVYPSHPSEYPEPMAGGEMGAEEALVKRRSVRSYAPRALTMSEVEYVLSCAVKPPRRAKSYPPMPEYLCNVYLVARDVEGLEPGVYLYELDSGLEAARRGDLSRELASAALGQEYVRRAQANIVVTSEGDVWRAELEAGMIGQNIYLAATAIGLGTVAIGAFYDEKVADTLGVDERPLYILPLGAL